MACERPPACRFAPAAVPLCEGDNHERFSRLQRLLLCVADFCVSLGKAGTTSPSQTAVARSDRQVVAHTPCFSPAVQFQISTLEPQMQDSSNFKCSYLRAKTQTTPPCGTSGNSPGLPLFKTPCTATGS